MSDHVATALQNWIPYNLFFDESNSLCKWLFVGDAKFTEPFFEETISKCRYSEHSHRSMKCVSSLEVLPDWSGNMECVQPTAFIFHVSRCGSTLASQLLALDPANIVLSEVPFFDELLRWRRQITAGDDRASLQLLKAAITFYGARRFPGQQRLFIKTDSWHIFFYDLLRKLFPQTPFILLYRRPDEVIRSHQNRRGMHAVPGLIEPELFGLHMDDIMEITLDEYTAMVLEKYFESFITIAGKDPLSFLVNYNEGPVAIVEKITEVSGFSIPERAMAGMKQRANYHGKYPGQVFSEEAIQLAAPTYLNKAIFLYESLEKIRKSITCNAQ